MRNHRLSAFVASLMLGATLLGSLAAEYDPIFDFIPLGGRSLLAKVFASKPPAADVRALLAGKHTRDEWLATLKAQAKTTTTLQSLDERELLTLADYLSFNMPLAKPPADPAKADWAKVLPRDGRDLALDYCQSCHIITVTITQDRRKEHWLGTMNKPSHVGIKLTPQEREALASYLVINAGIPIDQVPEELRAGGASY
jgi:hypothetical protein